MTLRGGGVPTSVGSLQEYSNLRSISEHSVISSGVGRDGRLLSGDYSNYFYYKLCICNHIFQKVNFSIDLLKENKDSGSEDDHEPDGNGVSYSDRV